MKRLALLPALALVLTACQDATQLTTPKVSVTYQSVHAVVLSTFTVTNTNDAGAGSLRQAILDANGSAGTDLIDFNIPAATDPGCNAVTGVCTIHPTSPLPTITDLVVIDGYTQPGASPNTNGPGLGLNTALKIELDGTNAGASANGLRITAGGSTVRGLVINRFIGAGLLLASNGSNLIEGNFIGTDVTGTADLGNSADGVISVSSDNTIGGTAPEARNVISGNEGFGVSIGAGTGNLVQGNFIGTDVTGTVDLGNTLVGVGTSTSNTTIGGTTAGARNVISGNDRAGVQLSGVGSGVTGTVVQGNFIGTDVTGTADLGNALFGVSIFDNANTLVGGTTSGAGNVISGNDNSGIHIGGARETVVQGNFIGTDVTGTIALGNSGPGVDITRFVTGIGVFNASDNTIGGTTAGAGNIISGNNSAGVRISFSGSTGNLVQGNSIFSNGGLGIDLGGDGVTPNDPGDGDAGPNDLMNFPVLSGAHAAPGRLVVRGTIDTPNPRSVTIQLFANPVPTPGADPSGHGEGTVFLGTVMPNKQGKFNKPLPPVVPGTLISATATDADGNTSEFAANIEAEERTGLSSKPPKPPIIDELQPPSTSPAFVWNPDLNVDYSLGSPAAIDASRTCPSADNTLCETLMFAAVDEDPGVEDGSCTTECADDDGDGNLIDVLILDSPGDLYNGASLLTNNAGLGPDMFQAFFCGDNLDPGNGGALCDGSDNGSYTVRILASDKAQPENHVATLDYSFVLDVTPPIIGFGGIIGLNASNAATVEFVLDASMVDRNGDGTAVTSAVVQVTVNDAGLGVACPGNLVTEAATGVTPQGGNDDASGNTVIADVTSQVNSNSGDFSQLFTAANLGAGAFTYCFEITADDGAERKDGTDDGQDISASASKDFTWQ